MDFSFSAEQNALWNRARETAKTALEPYAKEVDLKGAFPGEGMKGILSGGLFASSIPEEFGGIGGGLLERALIVEALGYACPSAAVTYFISMGSSGAFTRFGSKEQQKTYLPRVVKEGMLVSFALTEENAGCDVSGGRTTAIKEEDFFILNGEKTFVTSAKESGVCLVFAQTKPELGAKKGMSMLAVDLNSPGVVIDEKNDLMGLRGVGTYTVHFSNVRVPAENLVGEEGKGYRYALTLIDDGRIAVGAFAVAMASRAIDEAISHMKKRTQFNRPLSENQGLRWYLAEMKMELEAARLLTYQAAYYRDRLDPKTSRYAALCKGYAPEAALAVVAKALQLHGGNGVKKGGVIERLYRDVHALRIFDGTVEMQKEVTAKFLLG